jgi:hypothetical protein
MFQKYLKLSNFFFRSCVEKLLEERGKWAPVPIIRRISFKIHWTSAFSHLLKYSVNILNCRSFFVWEVGSKITGEMGKNRYARGVIFCCWICTKYPHLAVCSEGRECSKNIINCQKKFQSCVKKVLREEKNGTGTVHPCALFTATVRLLFIDDRYCTSITVHSPVLFMDTVHRGYCSSAVPVAAC